ncbi:MAG TPA: glucose 1-dehydrogenase [Deltaproteobacteria bacterium]|jgi:gluconate 5-dehydrogenase|nr:glucose 1-dehydrogenase [Deltaproteobacteria bacterium]HOI06585.1 glucose 1-dehydrogenase [Deltaproteobacteria bacterium]
MKVNELMNLKGKTAIVTGGGRGIGRFIAEGLAEAGADVVIASRKIQKCEEACNDLKALGVKTLAVKCDTSSEEDIQNLVDATMKEFGKIDILVNNAGITWGAPTLQFPLEKWDKIFAVNTRGVWILSQKAANIMKDQGGGKIINISSIMASRGSIEEGHPALPYNPSKAAVEILTKNLAVKLARYKIYVNCIAPGFFRTDMMEYVFKDDMKPILDIMLGGIPLHMFGEADHVKGLAVYLASKASDFMTGAIIPLDGGQGAM